MWPHRDEAALLELCVRTVKMASDRSTSAMVSPVASLKRNPAIIKKEKQNPERVGGQLLCPSQAGLDISPIKKALKLCVREDEGQRPVARSGFPGRAKVKRSHSRD